jgi:TonB family protein
MEMNPRNLSLVNAVIDGDTEAVRSLIVAGSDVNGTTSGGQTLLILAIFFRRTQILRMLLEAGADPHLPDSLGLNAVDWAERKGFAEGVEILVRSQVGKPEGPAVPRGTEPRPPSTAMSNQIEKPSIPAPNGPSQLGNSDDKSRRWVAGFKRRIDEENSKKAMPLQPLSLTNIEMQTEPPAETSGVVVNEDFIQDSTLVTEPTTASDTECVANSLSDTSPSEDQFFSAPAVMPVSSSDKLEMSPTPKWTIKSESATSSGRRRCPKCNTLYSSELLAYCARDLTPLVDADKPMINAPSEITRTPVVWLLVVFTFVLATGVVYLMTPSLKREQDSRPAALSSQTANKKDMPLVGGALSGKELTVPEPEYPASARLQHVSGSVTVRVTVDKTGRVRAVKVLKGDERLRSAAIAAAQRASFSAEKLKGRRAVGTVVYTFKE